MNGPAYTIDINISYQTVRPWQSNDNGMSILSVNAHSLRNKLPALEAEIVKYEYPEVIVVSETWLTDNIEQFFEIPNYTSYHTTRNDGWGGLTVYIMSKVEHTVRQVPSQKDNVHMSLIRMKQQKLNVLCVYRAPDPTNLDSFLDQLDSLLESHSDMVICGDFNIDLEATHNRSKTTEYKNIVESNSFKFLNQMGKDNYTFPINSGPGAPGSLVDHAFTDMLHLEYHLVNTQSIADHHCLLISIKKDSTQTTPQTTMIRSNTRITNSLCQYLRRLNNQTLLEIHRMMIETTKRFSYEKSPLRKAKIHWVNDEVISQMNKRELLYKRTKQKRISDEERNKRKEEYRTQKNKVTTLIRLKRNQFIDQHIEESMNDCKRMWQVMRQVLGKKKTRCERRYSRTDRNRI